MLGKINTFTSNGLSTLLITALPATISYVNADSGNASTVAVSNVILNYSITKSEYRHYISS